MLLGVYRSIHNGEREKERIYGQNWEILEHCGATLVALWSNPCCIGRDLNVCQIPRGKKKFEDHR